MTKAQSELFIWLRTLSQTIGIIVYGLIYWIHSIWITKFIGLVAYRLHDIVVMFILYIHMFADMCAHKRLGWLSG